MTAILLIALFIVNIPVYMFIYKVIFKDDEDFAESVKYSVTPDIFSLFKGRYWKDQAGEMKLSFFVIVCITVIVLEFSVLRAIIGIFIKG